MTLYRSTKSLFGSESAGSSRIAAFRSPVRSTVARWFGTSRSWTGTPASSATRSVMSWPLRTPGFSTGGLIREASGTRVVSGCGGETWPCSSGGFGCGAAMGAPGL